jgi:hypothetical protein
MSVLVSFRGGTGPDHVIGHGPWPCEAFAPIPVIEEVSFP